MRRTKPEYFFIFRIHLLHSLFVSLSVLLSPEIPGGSAAGKASILIWYATRASRRRMVLLILNSFICRMVDDDFQVFVDSMSIFLRSNYFISIKYLKLFYNFIIYF
jgi:hypothetical protein